MKREFTDKEMFNYGRSVMRKCFKYMPEHAIEFLHGWIWPFNEPATMAGKGAQFEYNRTHWLGNVFKQIRQQYKDKHIIR